MTVEVDYDAHVFQRNVSSWSTSTVATTACHPRNALRKDAAGTTKAALTASSNSSVSLQLCMYVHACITVLVKSYLRYTLSSVDQQHAHEPPEFVLQPSAVSPPQSATIAVTMASQRTNV